MADQDSPLSRALRLAMPMPEDYRNPLLHPEAVNHFAPPPQQPRAELRNLPPRPGDYLSPVSEALSPTMGAYGLGNALGDAYVQGREGNYKGMASPLAEILLSMAPVPGMKKGAMPPRVENPIRAYHGSPHDFDKFDLSKIGSGEGAQAYGHGLYFAEKEGVARSYRDALGGNRLKDGTPFNDRDPAHWAADAMQRAGGDRAKALEVLSADMTPDLKMHEGGHYQRLLRARALLEQGAEVPEMGRGKMYEVAIHASPDQFLDWDKPLSQQSEAVRKALAVDDHSMPGSRAYDALAEKIISDPSWEPSMDRFGGGKGQARQDVTTQLQQAGIPGIRYLDQGSRYHPTSLPKNPIADEARRFLDSTNGDPAAAKRLFHESNPIERWAAPEREEIQRVIDAAGRKQTSNFVVFDPALIEILRKYGLLGPVAAGATANALMGDKDQQ